MTIAQSTTSVSPRQDAWRRLKKNKAAMFGLVVLAVLVVLSVFAPWLTPYSYSGQDLELGPSPPSAQHWLGSDLFGRDLLTRMLYGSRVSLAVGFIATAVALLIGVTWGALAGYLGGRIDALMMRVVDVLYALPFTIFIILLMVVFGNNIILLFLAIGAVEWLTMARIVRGQVLHVKQQDFVEAAVSLGLTRLQVIRKHVIPNVMGPVIVYATLTVPNVILLESFLSFLGLGIQPPLTSWGLLINEAQNLNAILLSTWIMLPGVAIILTVAAFNFLGDGLRDAADPYN